jgi:uncharacterized cupredoxin-like copper-binding protein
VRFPLGILLIGVAGLLLLSGCAGDASGQEATVAIRYSRFDPAVVTVSAGEPVVITLRNDDPIEHEWIVGTPDVHERHRSGTEPFHDAIPTEVTIPSLATRVTMVTFETPGDYAFICHLPGHEAYGMTGTLRVVEG